MTVCLPAFLIDWLTGWVAGWLTSSLTDWTTGWMTDWEAGWLIDWLTNWLRGLQHIPVYSVGSRLHLMAVTMLILQNEMNCKQFDVQKIWENALWFFLFVFFLHCFNQASQYYPPAITTMPLKSNAESICELTVKLHAVCCRWSGGLEELPDCQHEWDDRSCHTGENGRFLLHASVHLTIRGLYDACPKVECSYLVVKLQYTCLWVAGFVRWFCRYLCNQSTFGGLF